MPMAAAKGATATTRRRTRTPQRRIPGRRPICSTRRGSEALRPSRRDGSLIAALLEARAEARRDPRADEARDVAAQPADLLHQARGDELLPVGSHEEHGLDLLIDPGIHAGHLELVFEIADGA